MSLSYTNIVTHSRVFFAYTHQIMRRSSFYTIASPKPLVYAVSIGSSIAPGFGLILPESPRWHIGFGVPQLLVIRIRKMKQIRAKLFLLIAFIVFLVRLLLFITKFSFAYLIYLSPNTHIVP